MISTEDNNGGAEQDERKKSDEFLIVGLGASAGGIKAFKEFFASVPAKSGMAYVVILHLSPEHESNLANVIKQKTSMPVMQVGSGADCAPLPRCCGRVAAPPITATP